MNFKLRFGMTTGNRDDVITFFKNKGGRLIAASKYDMFGDISHWVGFEFNESNIHNLHDCTMTVRTGEIEVNGRCKKWFNKKRRIFIKDIASKMMSVNG